MAENTAVAKTEEKAEVAHSNNKVTDYSLGIFGTSDNFIMAMQMAKALASSTIVPATFQKNDANCLIAIEQAQRLRVSPLMVMQNLYVIQGRPSWSSKFLIAAEPTRGVDIGAQEFIHDQLVEKRRKDGAILLVSSELSEILSLSDRVYVIYDGLIRGEFERKEFSTEKVGYLMMGGRNE